MELAQMNKHNLAAVPSAFESAPHCASTGLFPTTDEQTEFGTLINFPARRLADEVAAA